MLLSKPAAAACSLHRCCRALPRQQAARASQRNAASGLCRARQATRPAAAAPRCQALRPTAAAAASPAAEKPGDLEADVVVLGAGIIGLCTALALLRADPLLRVAVLDRKSPCSGATGAGQGYLWLAHRDVGSPAWHLAVASKAMWQQLLAPAVPQLTPAAVEWQSVGSMLIAATAEESEGLRLRQALLAAAGLEARLLSADDARQLEPALQLVHSAMLVPTDAQVNGKATAAALQQACEAHGGRFTTLFNEGAQALVFSPSGRAKGVRTEARRVTAAWGVVVAMGAWSGDFLAEQTGETRWADAFHPRRGLLLEMPRPADMPPVAHGLMEMGYTQHYSRGGSVSGDSNASAKAAVAAAEGEGVDITFTATTSASGTLLVGSSREFAGFGSDAPDSVVDSIMKRAAAFLPGLAAVQRKDISVRAGPRPYATAGTPMVGPVPGREGLLVAAGHEGSGLTLAPATAALVCEQLLGLPSLLPTAVTDSLRVPF